MHLFVNNKERRQKISEVDLEILWRQMLRRILLLPLSHTSCKLRTSVSMAQSKFEYVRRYEADDKLLPDCWIVVRIDGKAFHKFADLHGFAKPNDKKALDLMVACAKNVMNDLPDILLAYGQSDEFSFIIRKNTGLYSRRSSKIMTNIVSLFAASYVHFWTSYLGPDRPLVSVPSFDARTVLYPTNKTLRDYLSWRQADCHINNLYNTVFWSLVLKGGMTNKQAEERLKGTVASEKNEILFSQFGINYNNEPEQFRKGTTIWRKRVELEIVEPREKMSKKMETSFKTRTQIQESNCDIIGDQFWNENPEIIDI